MILRTSVLWKINTHTAKKWPGMVLQRSFIKGHSFRNTLYHATLLMIIIMRKKTIFFYRYFLNKIQFSELQCCNVAAHSGGRLLSKQSCKSRGQLNWSGHQFAGSHSRKPHVSCCYDVDDTAGSWQTKLIVNMFVHLLYYCCFCVSTCTWPNLRNETTLKRPIW
jgi:hypothetical protein